MNHSFRTPQNSSDSKYIFILFALIFIVLLFTSLIYFVYENPRIRSEFLGLENAWLSQVPQTLDDIRVAEAAPLWQDQQGTIALAPIVTISPTVTATTNTSVDVSRYNPRTTETLALKGRQLLDKYFSSIQWGDYQTACSLLSNTLCNARRDIYAFSQFLSKTDGGYIVKSVTLAPEQKPTEMIFCVEYSYTLKADLNPEPVTEYFQYRIQTRPDGGDEISARVCEKIIKDGRERSCPIVTPKKYCY